MQGTILEKYMAPFIDSNRDGQRYKGNLGDIIQDFIQHERKPWWKRRGDHRLISEKFKAMLNQYGVDVVL